MIFFADLDECADNNRTCSSGHDCINTLGSYRCRFPCPDGFVRTLNETCVGNSCIFLFKQQNNYRYTDNLAYITYGNVGQKFDKVTQNMIRNRRALIVVFCCVFSSDVDECEVVMSEESLQANDPCRQSCQNFPGFFRCSCKDGYQLRNNKCQGTKKDKCSLYKRKENQHKWKGVFSFRC